MKSTITSIAIEDKMKDAYLSYSLSVIVGRALPDVRDGLKPVHRRILYAARDMGLTPDKPYKKSARIVGEVLGKYHPHGDAAVYNAMVRMAQDFAQRYPLIDGHGNFGSIDGDNPAAMRYTEVRLAPFSMDLLADINKETVEFVPNFDNTLKEPVILPSRIPNLLVNGSSGIAVGMSTDIPPHNLREVIDGLIQLLENPEISIDKLMKTIKGPDFPTGGEIVGIKGIHSAYKTGQGRITIRARAKIESKSKTKDQIIITEIPYQLQKAKLIEEIADAVNKEKITNISDIRDESDRDGMRIVIELKPNANSKIILNQLYKYTSMQTTYRINMLALVGKQPKILNLKEILEEFLKFRKEVVIRRTRYELRHAEDRLHVLKGLKIAIDKLDLIIQIIRSSKSTSKAKEKLIKTLNITEIQADAILKMQLQRLVGMEQEKIEIEINELNEKIANLKLILNNKEALKNLIKKELLEIKDKYGDPRRTTIIEDASKAEIDTEDLIKEEDVVVTLSYRQYIKRTNDPDNIRAGKKDFITHILKGTTLDRLLFFTRSGNCYGLNVYEISEHHPLSTGDPLNNYIKIPLDDEIVNVIMLNKETKEKFITIATAKGMIKKTIASEYESSITQIKAINLDDDDYVIGVKVTDGKQNILLGTRNGMTIHFAEEEVSATGRNTKGCIGIKLDDNDQVISFNLTAEDHYVVALTKDSRGKRTHIFEYKIQKRNGKGLKTLSSNNYQLLNIISGKKDQYLVFVKENGDLKELQIKDITETQRTGNMYSQKELGHDQLIEIVAVPIVPEWVKTEK
ncbi:DNA gyrase subunit A [Anoxybacter fermentans]|uniref:DNA topoisomerase (ATP-hydrolyzing) n=1 Tax=Anoxybacter fermentans TaxID=1323375 RepID=A0A3S9SWM0_9FIRM|nr:DNA gyrase subunit A [Anoxybacter fermentans]AZR72630.1 DNA gyrase subunit A [Anoxybacter fermentans]